MSKAILIVDIDDGIDLSAVEIEYYVYDISIHDIPFGKKIIKAGGVYSPKPLPKKYIKIAQISNGKVINTEDMQFMAGYNKCLDEILGEE